VVLVVKYTFCICCCNKWNSDQIYHSRTEYNATNKWYFNVPALFVCLLNNNVIFRIIHTDFSHRWNEQSVSRKNGPTWGQVFKQEIMI